MEDGIKTIKEIKEIIKKTIEERYSDEGVERIRITQLEFSTWWDGFVEVVLKNKTKKEIDISITEKGDLESFSESDGY